MEEQLERLHEEKWTKVPDPGTTRRWRARAYVLLGSLSLGPLSVIPLFDGLIKTLCLVTWGVGVICVWVALVWAESERRLKPLAPGTRAITASLPRSILMMTAWVLVVVSLCLMTADVFVGRSDTLPRRHPLPFAVLGVLSTIYYGILLLCGRLHLPRLEIADEGISYQGPRKENFAPWSEVNRIGTNRRGVMQVGLKDRRIAIELSPWSFDVAPMDILQWLEAAHPDPRLLTRERRRLSRRA